MNKNILPIAAVICLALIGVRKLNAARNFSFFLRGVSFKSFPNAELIFAIQNPSRDRFKLDSVTGSVSVNGNSVGSISNFKEVVIMPNGETLMRIKVEPSLVGIGETFAQMFMRKKAAKFIVNFTGVANVGGLQIPLNINYNL